MGVRSDRPFRGHQTGEVTEQCMNEDNRPVDDALRRQVRVLAAGAVVGMVMLGTAVVVDLAGLNDPRTPQLPAPGSTLMPRLPSNSSMPTGLPSGVPTDFPTTLPSFPTDLPGIPTMPGGAP